MGGGERHPPRAVLCRGLQCNNCADQQRSAAYRVLVAVQQLAVPELLYRLGLWLLLLLLLRLLLLCFILLPALWLLLLLHHECVQSVQGGGVACPVGELACFWGG